MSRIWNFLKFVVAAFCGAGFLWVFSLLYQVVNFPDAISSEPLATLDISYVDFLTIMLTCVTIVLAAVGIGVGVIAAYTIKNLKDDAKAEVKKAMGDLEKNLDKKVTAVAYNVGRNLEEDEDSDEEAR